MTDPNPEKYANPYDQAVMFQNISVPIPLGIEQLDLLLRLISAAKEHIRSFACLGTDLTLLTGAILNEHAGARGLIVDFSPGTDGKISRQSPSLGPNLNVIKLDHSSHDSLIAMARFAPLDAVILGSQLHISAPERRVLFSGIFNLLNPGGIFLSLGDLPSAVRWTESLLDDYAIEKMFGEHLRRNAGKSRKEVAQAYFAETEKSDTIAPLEVQCDWLAAVGFESVDCYSKAGQLTIFGGQRPAQRRQ